MKKNALYFPYINIPASSFLIETLIYWDKLSSIVPYEFASNPSMLNQRMRELSSAGLVEHIQPREYFSRLYNFEEDFLDIARKWKVQNLNTQFPYTRIHIEKLGNLYHNLIELQLAKVDTYPWLTMPDPLATLLMTFLATKLGELPELNATPITNLTHEYSNEQHNNTSMIRDDILKEILPLPHGKITIDSILKYKNDYGHLTAGFRGRIEEECINIINTDIKYRDDKFHSIVERLESEINEIEETMNYSWKKIARQSIMPLMGSAMISTSTNFNSNIELILGTGLAALSPILEGVSTYKESKNIIKKPLAYATITKQTLYSEFQV